ncbi:acetyltransferase [Streptomyces sp. NBC_01142]|uniref:acetyltransferase n=1 Tax=Streptomyces sp. NBC_01142 TaxID=2975865 RepID=UPI00224EBEB7|nr:acetyltransferase [Streptomyces sp. NBC_01142]MCX4818499.1 acetyltransferase [Streptomyces sp. NBC_01142]
MRTSVQRFTVIATAVGALAALGATPANAATPASLCGSGYTQIDSHVLRKSATVELARVHLLYNASTRYNCVVTTHTSATSGQTLPTGAWITPSGGSQKKDQDDYSSYAGPVKVQAAGRCVKWGGMIEAGVGTYAYTSPWEHCG